MARLKGHYKNNDMYDEETANVLRNIQKNVIAYHFCNANNMKTLLGKPFLQGIAHSLKDYSEPFRASYSPDSDAEYDLRVAFEDAMDEMPEPGEQKFILVDGLDWMNVWMTISTQGVPWSQF